MKIKTWEVAGLRPALYAMRLPMKSNDQSDSGYCNLEMSPSCEACPHARWHEGNEMECKFPRDDFLGCWAVGPDDHELSTRLIKAGSDHRKHIRQIVVWVEIKAPLFWWKQFDTYRMGVEKVSESTMHTLMKKLLSLSDFELPERSDPESNLDLYERIGELEYLRDIGDFEGLNALLPQSYKQTRMLMISYEALHNMYHARKNHKLKQWRQFCEWIEALPYSEFITGETV